MTVANCRLMPHLRFMPRARWSMSKTKEAVFQPCSLNNILMFAIDKYGDTLHPLAAGLAKSVSSEGVVCPVAAALKTMWCWPNVARVCDEISLSKGSYLSNIGGNFTNVLLMLKMCVSSCHYFVPHSRSYPAQSPT